MAVAVAAVVSACSGEPEGDAPAVDGGSLPDAAPDTTPAIDSSVPRDAGDAGDAGDAADAADSPPPCTTRAECAALAEKDTAARYDVAIKNPVTMKAFLKDVPKGGDLHNHLTGAVYAETFLAWAAADGNCINSTTHRAVFSSQCTPDTQATPSPGAPFFDEVVRAWSMKDFVPGAETGRTHFFATFGKFGLVAGNHRDQGIADVLRRAADENQLYVETMFNMGRNIGTLSAALWSGTLRAGDLPTLYDSIINDPTFAKELGQDLAIVNAAAANYKNDLGCAGATPSPGCKVGVRFVAQVARTGPNDNIFGQLISAFEMAAQTPHIVAANLSSPEDDTTALNNYGLHMAMLDFLHQKYKVTGLSPLHITLHAGELIPLYLPPAHANANTFHIRQAIQIGHAERIGHGLDVLSETDSALLLAEMKTKNVMVEICLSSNDQILEVKGTNHPLSEYLKSGVPVALATDDLGVSRSSMAGEYALGALDQKLTYLQLKAMARNSLEHAFLPGGSLWTSITTKAVVADCAPTATSLVGDPPSVACQTFLDTSERAAMQWELEKRFLAFEKKP